MFFEILKKDKKTRAGILKTAHGDVPTPIFMPVGTRASVKGMWQEQLEELNAPIILGNTYHLFLRPGHELIQKVSDGLHGFMSFKGAILTDSGGFQVYSLSKLNKITEEGVVFKSHLDGTSYLIGPEKSMEIQRALGSDIVMNFDDCPKLPATKEDLRTSMELTLRWAKRCREFPLREYQKRFAIVQGGLHQDLRQECMERLLEMDFDGMALGGLSVGEKNEEMEQFLENFVHKMPENKPRYLMGVGTPLNILHAVKQGVDMFDCVLPTRNARNGQLITRRGPLSIKKERFKEDTLPPDPDCDCRVCKRYHRSYIRHLYNVGEYLAGELITFHNLHFYLKMMSDVRKSIQENQFDEYYRKFYNDYTSNFWN